jgi:hypothetical protein
MYFPLLLFSLARLSLRGEFWGCNNNMHPIPLGIFQAFKISFFILA